MKNKKINFNIWVNNILERQKNLQETWKRQINDEILKAQKQGLESFIILRRDDELRTKEFYTKYLSSLGFDVHPVMHGYRIMLPAEYRETINKKIQEETKRCCNHFKSS